MKKLILILLFLLTPILGWGTDFYVQKDPGNAGQVCYKSGSWPAGDCSDATADNTDIEAVLAAANSGTDIVILDGGAAGVTYSGTELDAADNIDTQAAVTIKGSSDSSHDGTVTIDGVGLGDNTIRVANDAHDLTLENLTLTDSDAGKSAIFSNVAATLLINDVIFDSGDLAVEIRGAPAAATVMTFNRCVFKDQENTTKAILIGDAAAQHLTLTFNYCRFEGSNSRAVRIQNCTALVFNNCNFIGSDGSVLEIVAGDTCPVTLNNCIVTGNVTDDAELVFDINGTGPITSNNSIILPKAFNGDTYHWDAITANNTLYISPKFTSARYPAYMIISVDDYANYADWKTLADYAQGLGVYLTLNLDSVYESAMEWDEMAGYAEDGHDIASHSRGSDSDLTSLDAITLDAAPANSQIVISAAVRSDVDPEVWTMTLDAQDNCDTVCATVGGVFPISLTFDAINADSYDTLLEVKNAITAIGVAWTASVHADAGDASPSIVLDPGTYDADAGDTIVFDNAGTAGDNIIEKYWYVAIAWAKDRIEEQITASANYTGTFTCAAFVAPGHSQNAALRAWVMDDDHFTPLGSTAFGIMRGENALWGDTSYLLSSIVMNRITAQSMISNFNGADVVRNAGAAAAEMGYLGIVTYEFLHAFGDISEQEGKDIIKEIVGSGTVQIITADALNDIIRDSGDWADSGDGITWNRALSDSSDYNLESGSAAIGAGVGIAGLGDSLSGPVGNRTDIGAYEYPMWGM